MKNPLFFIKSILNRFTPPAVEKVTPVKLPMLTRIKNLFTPPEPPMGTTSVRKKVMISAETEAQRRAMEVIRVSGLHPNDKTYDLARRKAVEYLTRAGKLEGGGKLQNANRYNVAKRYIDYELSTPEGISERKQKKREVFDANFNLELSDRQHETMEKLMASDSFEQLMELHRSKYEILIGMAADAVQKNVNTRRVQKALEMWEGAYLEPDFDAFRQVVDLDSETWNKLMDDLEEKSGTIAWKRGDDIDRRMMSQSILGRYITWTPTNE